MKKVKYVEFHCHTNLSDGNLSPEELIQKAIENQIGVISITDHNRLLTKEELIILRKKFQGRIEIVEGIEVSTNYDKKQGDTDQSPTSQNQNKPTEKQLEDVHMVVLTTDGDRIRFLADRKIDNRGRFNEQREKLALCGKEIPDYDTFKKRYPETEHVGRKHIEDYMYDHGQISYRGEGYDLYFGKYGKKLAWVDAAPYKAAYKGLEETIREIREAGGDSIIAIVLCHPLYYRFNKWELNRLMTRFKEAAGPLAAMEVLYGRYNKKQRAWLAKKAKEFGFLISAGSDYHGQSEKDSLDNRFPMKIWDRMLENWKRIFHQE
ncbi:MAG: PHP domain-containing protein [Lachnospiraceae bacterium]|nr:PHP domain-containing protein [Lachnospiraceae bacterium]